MAQDRDELEGCCGQGNEPSVSLTRGVFLEWLTK